MEYIIGKYGRGRLAVAPDKPNYADYLYWFHFANGSMMPSQMSGLGNKPGEEESPRARFMRARCDRAWDMVEERLGKAPYLAGADFTAADIIMLFPLTTMRAFVPRDIAKYPHIKAYLQRIGERAGYRRAMQKGDPNMAPMLS
jgi:glutathione S-transferase